MWRENKLIRRDFERRWLDYWKDCKLNLVSASWLKEEMSIPKINPDLFISRLDLLYKSWEVSKGY